MLITLVFIEKNCTFNLEVSRLCVSVSSGHLSTGTPCLIKAYIIMVCAPDPLQSIQLSPRGRTFIQWIWEERSSTLLRNLLSVGPNWFYHIEVQGELGRGVVV